MADVGGPLLGTAGNDLLVGDARDLSPNGVDNYSNSNSAALLGLDGHDILVGDVYDAISYDTEGDELRGGNGNDILFGDTAPDLTTYGFTSFWVGDPIWDSRIDGSSDQLYGDAGRDTIYGGGGFDQIFGGTGNDKLYGQRGGDFIYGDQGDDDIWGGEENDQVYGGAGIDTILGEGGNDFLYGEAFNSSVGDRGDLIKGGTGDDDIRGGAGADRLLGESGDDRIQGGGLSSDASNDLADQIFGGTGDDTIDGNFGNDLINGGAGIDIMTGGADADVFEFRSGAEARRTTPDIITDFQANATDLIDFSAIDAIAGGLDDALVFRSARAFTGIGQVRVYQSGFNTFVDVNLSGTAAPELRIQLNGLLTLDRADFIL